MSEILTFCAWESPKIELFCGWLVLHCRGLVVHQTGHRLHCGRRAVHCHETMKAPKGHEVSSPLGYPGGTVWQCCTTTCHQPKWNRSVTPFVTQATSHGWQSLRHVFTHSWQIRILHVFLWPCAVFLHVACKMSLCGVIHMPYTARWYKQCRKKFRKTEIAFYFLIIHPFSRQATTCAEYHTIWCIFLFPRMFAVQVVGE